MPSPDAQKSPPTNGTVARAEAASRAQLLPTLGLFSTIMLVVGGVIGSGIFRKPGVMAAQLGSPELLLLVWVLAGFITLCGALTNAEIAGLIPETGGQYVYFERLYGPGFAFLYGWAIFSIIQCGSIAAVAYVFAEYSSQLISLPEFSGRIASWSVHVPGVGQISPGHELGIKIVAAILIGLLTAINYCGVRFGGLVQNIFTVAKIAAMLLLVLGAFTLSTSGTLTNLTRPATNFSLSGLALFAGVAAALQGAFWAYDGWNKLTYIAGEIRQPQRNIPLGLLWGLLMVTTIYVLMNVAYAYVLPIDAMAQSKLVAADVADRLFTGGSRWVAALVMLSTFGTVNAIILATARVYFSMAHRNLFPRFVGKVHPRFHTPAASLVVQGAWSIALLFSGTFDTLTDTLIFVTWIFYAAGAFGVFLLRRRMPDSHRPYRVVGYPLVPGIFIVFATGFLVFTIYNDITNYQQALAAAQPAVIESALGLALVSLGIPIYLLFRKLQKANNS